MNETGHLPPAPTKPATNTDSVDADTAIPDPTPALSGDERELYEKIPTDGLNVGNISLRRDLQWEDQRYWDARQGLIDKGLVSLSRGRGGGVRRVGEARTQSATAEVTGVQGDGAVANLTPAITKQKELDFYHTIASTLNTQWAPDLGYENFGVEVIAQQGRRPTGGAWTRPDIVLVNVANYRYVPGRFLDVITFELKLAEETDVKAVYEALAHRRAGTRAYLVIVGGGSVAPEELDEILREAGRHGVGVVEAKNAGRLDAWIFHVEPTRADTDPSDLDEFIETQVSPELRRKIALWVK